MKTYYQMNLNTSNSGIEQQSALESTPQIDTAKELQSFIDQSNLQIATIEKGLGRAIQENPNRFQDQKIIANFMNELKSKIDSLSTRNTANVLNFDVKFVKGVLDALSYRIIAREPIPSQLIADVFGYEGKNFNQLGVIRPHDNAENSVAV